MSDADHRRSPRRARRAAPPERAQADCRTRASARSSPTTWSPRATRRSSGWHDARLTAYAPLDARPGDHGPALRAGDLRGPQGLPPARRLGRAVPAGAERRAASSARPAGSRCPSCPRSCSSTRCAPSSTPTATGCRPATGRPVPAAVRCSRSSRSSASGRRSDVPVPADRLAGRRVLPRRRAAGLGVALDRVRPRGAGRHRRGQVRRQLRRLPASPRPQAAEQGCDQVVWLDAVEHRCVEEMGGMNLYFVYADGRLVTPALTGTLLPGVTRDSILTLGARPRPGRRGAPDQHRRVGGRLRRRHDQRGLRLRHRCRRHAGRRGQARRRAASRWPTASPARSP